MNQYKPDYAIPPGETVKEIFGVLIGIGQRNVDKFFKGDIRINKKIAKGLSDVLVSNGDIRINEQFWINLDKNYIKTKKRISK